MTTVYDKNDVSLYRVRMDQKDYRWIAVAKDDNGAIELCRAIVRLEREGHIVQDVFAVSPNGVSVAMNLRGFKEFRQAEKEPEKTWSVPQIIRNSRGTVISNLLLLLYQP